MAAILQYAIWSALAGICVHAIIIKQIYKLTEHLFD